MPTKSLVQCLTVSRASKQPPAGNIYITDDAGSRSHTKPIKSLQEYRERHLGMTVKSVFLISHNLATSSTAARLSGSEECVLDRREEKYPAILVGRCSVLLETLLAHFP